MTVQLGGAAPDGKIPFSLMTKGGEIYQMQRTKAWFQGEQIYQIHRTEANLLDAEDRGMVLVGA